VRFGIAYATHPDVIDSCVEADHLGYDAVHLYDSPLVFSEVFSVAGAVAARTENVRIGISVAVPHLRLPHVLAAGMGTLSAMAPGRVQLALGTGFTAALTTGSKADTWATVADVVGVCRGILHDELTEAPVKGGRRLVKHLHADHGFINTRDEVPIHISAAGPKGLRVTAELADGFYTMSAGQRPVPAQVAETVGVLNDMAAEAGRGPLPVTLFTTMAVKDADEASDSDRLRGFVGPAVTQHFHGDLGFGVEDPRTPPLLREAARTFYTEVGSKITGPAPYVQQHRGHAMFLREEEAHLLTPELIEAVCQIGTADELIDEISAMERSGVDEIVWQVMPGHEAEVARFAAEIMGPYRSRFADGVQ
jgi:5,10-methylenetetrahydromethanopterin reductase